MQPITRRIFVRQSAMGLFALGIAPSLLSESFLSRALAAGPVAIQGKVVVVIFQRGACDGLSMVAPLKDSNYRALRPHIALSSQGEGAAVALNGDFGLNPGLSALKPFWDEGTLALVHQVGSPDPTRSHFDAQDYMESGTPGSKTTEDGYLNRAMQIIPESQISNLRAVALEANLPRSLQGRFPAISMNSIHEFGFNGVFAKPQMVQGFEQMYQQATDRVFRGVGEEVFQTLKTVHATEEANKNNKEDTYPKAPIGRHLREIATLIKAKIGLQIATTDCGGWDTHVNQGDGNKGQLKDRLKELGDSIAAFAKDLGPQFQDVVLVTMTEFGRTVKENGDHGTDHGHGSVMMVLGGNVTGKKIIGNWKDLTPQNLQEGRDVPVTTDYRAVMSSIFHSQFGVDRFEKVFPGWNAPGANDFMKVMRS